MCVANNQEAPVRQAWRVFVSSMVRALQSAAAGASWNSVWTKTASKGDKQTPQPPLFAGPVLLVTVNAGVEPAKQIAGGRKMKYGSGLKMGAAKEPPPPQPFVALLLRSRLLALRRSALQARSIT